MLPIPDVLQRVAQHPAARVAELTPRLWKVHFADNPLRSDLYGLPDYAKYAGQLPCMGE